MALLIALGVATLLTRVGFALYAAGLVRAKNSAATVFRVIVDVCITVLAFWLVGAAILLQDKNDWLAFKPAFFGWQADHPAPRARGASAGSANEIAISEIPFLVFFFVTIILNATGVVGGAVAERCRLLPVCLSSLLLGAFVLPVAGNWAWYGWLFKRGFFDAGGACALHVSAGVFAMVAAFFVGPRAGKYHRDGSSSMIPGHNLPLASIGVLLLSVGWIAYVMGVTLFPPGHPRMNLPLPPILDGVRGTTFAGAAAMNVLLCAAAAGLASVVVSYIRYGKADLLLMLAGLLGGLVSICGGGALLPNWAAAAIGAVAGIIIPLAVVAIDLRLRLDDPLGIIAIHGIGGAWGTIAAGIFTPHVFTFAKTRISQIGVQVTGLVSVALFSAAVAFALFLALKATIGLRAKEGDEFDGLDLAEHDIGAYPDFQQNTIKSYHMREA
jgi:Amt family ammonium transporter